MCLQVLEPPGCVIVVIWKPPRRAWLHWWCHFLPLLPSVCSQSCLLSAVPLLHINTNTLHMYYRCYTCGKLYRNTHKLTLKIYKSLLLPTLHGKNVQTSWKGFSPQISILLATHTCLDISDAALYFCSGISPTSTPHWLTL